MTPNHASTRAEKVLDVGMAICKCNSNAGCLLQASFTLSQLRGLARDTVQLPIPSGSGGSTAPTACWNYPASKPSLTDPECGSGGGSGSTSTKSATCVSRVVTVSC